MPEVEASTEVEDDDAAPETEDDDAVDADDDNSWIALSTRILGMPADADTSSEQPTDTAVEPDATPEDAGAPAENGVEDDEAVIAAFMNAHRTEAAQTDEPDEPVSIADAPALSAIAALIDEADAEDAETSVKGDPAEGGKAANDAPLAIDMMSDAEPDGDFDEAEFEAEAVEEPDLASDLAALVALAEDASDEDAGSTVSEPEAEAAPAPPVPTEDIAPEAPLSLVAEADEDLDDSEDAIAADSFDAGRDTPLDAGLVADLVADDFAASADADAENIGFDALPNSDESVADKLARMRAAMPDFEVDADEESPAPTRRVSEAVFVQSAAVPMASDGRPEPETAETDDAADVFEEDFDDLEAMEEDWVEEAAVAADDQDGDDEEVVLSEEDEDDLQAELARIAEETEREANRAKRESRRIMLNSDRDADTGAAETSRLFEATASRLSTAETSRRLANFEHLKAAVAARAADRQMVEREAREQDERAAEYREDLARVMRPRRVQVDTSRREAESDQSPAAASPLVLVTEQRVEAPGPQAAAPSLGGLALAEDLEERERFEPPQPLRLENADPVSLEESEALADPLPTDVEDAPATEGPTQEEPRGGLGSSLVNLGLRTGLLRRVDDTTEASQDDPTPEPEAAPEQAAQDTDLGAGLLQYDTPTPVIDEEPSSSEQGDGLTDAFRAHAGAPDPERPQDYLELAAAWMLRHEEQPAVSRPVLMRLVTIASDGEIGREEALRAFGILLREGKLEKIARGQFRLTSRSRHYNS